MSRLDNTAMIIVITIALAVISNIFIRWAAYYDPYENAFEEAIDNSIELSEKQAFALQKFMCEESKGICSKNCDSCPWNHSLDEK